MGRADRLGRERAEIRHRFGLGLHPACNEVQNWRGREGRDQRHDDEHREQGRRDDFHLEADVEDDQFHQPAGVHQDAERRCVTPVESGEACGDRAAAEFANRRDGNDERADRPLLHAADQTDLRAQSGVGEKRGQQQNDHDIFEAIGQIARHPAVVRNHRAKCEGPEHGVDADHFSGAGREQERDEDRRHHALRQPSAIAVEQTEANHRGAHDEQHHEDVG